MSFGEILDLTADVFSFYIISVMLSVAIKWWNAYSSEKTGNIVPCGNPACRTLRILQECPVVKRLRGSYIYEDTKLYGN